MAGGRRATFRREERLTSGADYRRVFRQGRRLEGPYFTLIALASERDHDRVGMAVSRRVGGSVARNRAKRLVREAFRRLRRTGPRENRGLDLVLVLKPGVVAASQKDVDLEYEGRLRRLGRRKAGPRGARAADGN